MFNWWKKINNKNGFTLVEMTVAAGLFGLIVLSMTQIFHMTIKAQQDALASQNLQENLRYVFEAISKEVRMAQKGEANECEWIFSEEAINKTYNVITENGHDALFFKNQYGNCVGYFFENNTVRVIRGAHQAQVTPNSVNVTDLNFEVKDYEKGEFSSGQARVMLNLTMNTSQGLHKDKEIIMQTAISSRVYE